MIRITTDVDIDVLSRDQILESLDCIFGSIHRQDKVDRHPSGVYFQNIPKDPFTNIALMDHKEANECGYFKIDFLNISLYEGIKNEKHLLRLMDTKPDWDLFQYSEITDSLFQLNGHSRILQKFKPRTVEELAMILAIIRPAKAYLQSSDWEKVKKEVWDKSLDRTEYSFKRSHSIAYSLAVIVNLNLLVENASKLSE